jgi:hypothetical protein
MDAHRQASGAGGVPARRPQRRRGEPHKDPEARRAYWAAYRAAHREEQRAYDAVHPRVSLAGERTRIDQLPEALQPVALLIRETRQEIRKR